MNKWKQQGFILLLVITILFSITYSAAAVSELEQKISKRNMELYIEEYGVAELKPEKKKEVEQLFNSLTTEAKKDDFRLNFRYKIIDAPVINAAYLGDGRMILFKGLIDEVENNNQLAAIVAHEIGHGVNQDIKEKIDWIQTIQLGTLLADLAGDGEINQDNSSKITALALNLLQRGYSRSQEKEADYYSVFLTNRAGYDPDGAVGVMKLLKKKQGGAADSALLEVFASHPNLNKRINYLTELVTKVKDVDKYYYSPIATARRFTKGLLNDNLEIIYKTYGEQVHEKVALSEFKKQSQVKKVRNKVSGRRQEFSYQIDLRNQVEQTARVAVLLEQKNKATLGLALDLKKGNYGWKIINGPDFY
ncbi:MAG: M48 family metallopeptidase [Bacillota bacterium]